MSILGIVALLEMVMPEDRLEHVFHSRLLQVVPPSPQLHAPYSKLSIWLRGWSNCSCHAPQARAAVCFCHFSSGGWRAPLAKELSGLSSPDVTEEAFAVEGAGTLWLSVVPGEGEKQSQRLHPPCLVSLFQKPQPCRWLSNSLVSCLVTFLWMFVLNFRGTPGSQAHRQTEQSFRKKLRQPCWEAREMAGPWQRGPAIPEHRQQESPASWLRHCPSSSPVLLPSVPPLWFPGVRPMWALFLEANSLGMWAPALTLLFSGCPGVSTQRRSPPVQMVLQAPPVQIFWLSPLSGEADSGGRGRGGGERAESETT